MVVNRLNGTSLSRFWFQIVNLHPYVAAPDARLPPLGVEHGVWAQTVAEAVAEAVQQAAAAGEEEVVVTGATAAASEEFVVVRSSPTPTTPPHRREDEPGEGGRGVDILMLDPLCVDSKVLCCFF